MIMPKYPIGTYCRSYFVSRFLRDGISQGFIFRDSNWKIRKKGIKIRDSSVLNFSEVLKSSRYTGTSKTHVYFFLYESSDSVKR